MPGECLASTSQAEKWQPRHHQLQRRGTDQFHGNTRTNNDQFHNPNEAYKHAYDYNWSPYRAKRCREPTNPGPDEAQNASDTKQTSVLYHIHNVRVFSFNVSKPETNAIKNLFDEFWTPRTIGAPDVRIEANGPIYFRKKQTTTLTPLST